MHTLLNEGLESWNDAIEELLKYNKDGNSLIDVDFLLFILDGDKGGASAVHKNFKKTSPFVCRQHRSENFASNSDIKKGDKERYSRIADATNRIAKDAAIYALTGKEKLYIDKLPYAVQFKLDLPPGITRVEAI
mmetsp:Transcript_4921/g.7408  ORF Transcript_4921/g.7408 Transcript_4921/m.7408 type:complete len:134 (+) Transcript_4921:286-687(+)